ncbi:MAG TPA: carboxylesterase family protein [Ramlibacter sp.]|nr:carboxylesterase family protein [Ramlibacter sp.]
MRRAAHWALAAMLPVLAACGGGGGSSNDPLMRQTSAGPIVGASDSASATYAWKGVPYAKPPVGALRWSAPVDVDSWTATKTTTAFGNACVQYGRIYGPGANNKYDATIGTTLNTPVGSEDCLYLNVWRPATAEGNLPIIVFFHGGSNVSGYTADPMYDGASLAKNANAIVVTPNFRLGIFGFLNLPQVNGTASGNYTMLDSIKALQFVRANALVFGGNPENVTIVGQSAGAINVWALQTSPAMVAANPKLFHRVMPMSGGISLATNLPAGSIPTLSPAAQYLAQGNSLLQNFVIADGFATDAASAQAYIATKTNAQIADYMRSKTSAQVITTLLTKLALVGLAGSGPIPDGTVVASDAIAAINAGNYVKVPVLASNARDEGKLFPSFLPLVGGAPPSARLVTDAQLFANHFSYNPNAAPATTVDQWIAASYLPVNTPVTGFTARAELLNSVFFLRSRDNVLNALKAKQDNVWYYRFDWDKQPAPWNDIYGAVHVIDLPFLFGNFGPSLFGNVWFNDANKAGRLELSSAMQQSISSFARSGDPNNAALGTTWAPWPSRLVFDASLTAKAIHSE